MKNIILGEIILLDGKEFDNETLVEQIKCGSKELKSHENCLHGIKTNIVDEPTSQQTLASVGNLVMSPTVRKKFQTQKRGFFVISVGCHTRLSFTKKKEKKLSLRSSFLRCFYLPSSFLSFFCFLSFSLFPTPQPQRQHNASPLITDLNIEMRPNYKYYKFTNNIQNAKRKTTFSIKT